MVEEPLRRTDWIVSSRRPAIATAVKREVRETVVSSRRRTCSSDPPYSKMDLVSCRNLLIYLDAERRRVACSRWRISHSSDGGYLVSRQRGIDWAARPSVLDRVETLAHLPAHQCGRQFHRRSTLPVWPPVQCAWSGRPAKPKLADVTIRALADRFGPTSVVIDQQFPNPAFPWRRLRNYLTQPSRAAHARPVGDGARRIGVVDPSRGQAST